jgi:hypothetical protein
MRQSAARQARQDAPFQMFFHCSEKMFPQGPDFSAKGDGLWHRRGKQRRLRQAFL